MILYPLLIILFASLYKSGTVVERNFINTWVSTSTKGTTWNTAVDYCTWTGFTCDGNSNLVSISYTCSSSESFDFPPLDFWTSANQNATAFAFTTSIIFNDCLMGYQVPSFLATYWRQAPLNFNLNNARGTPHLNCPLPTFFASGSQGLTCSNAGMSAVTPNRVASAGGVDIVLTVNKPVNWINVTCDFNGNRVVPSLISFSPYSLPFWGSVGFTTSLTCRVPAGLAGRVALSLYVASTVVTNWTDGLVANSTNAYNKASSTWVFFVEPCADGFQPGVSNGVDTCVPCAAGSFINVFTRATPTSPCLPCPTGTFAPTPGFSSCIRCPMGWVSAGGATACTPCAPGSSPDATQSTCVACPVGFEAKKPASPSCTRCGGGYGSSVAGTPECTLCSAGAYQDPSVTAGTCTSCPTGFYSSQQGSIRCLTCPDGFSTMATGSTSSAACVACDVGSSRKRFQPGGLSMNSCTQCPVGYFANSTGQPVCTACPRGFYQNLTGQSVCIRCPVGSDNIYPASTSCIEGFVLPPQGLLANTVTDPNNDPGTNRRTVGIVLVSIGGAVFVLGILIAIIAAVILYLKFDELRAIEGGIESLKDLQNNRL